MQKLNSQIYEQLRDFVKIHNNLDENTKIYRITDFFSAALMLAQSKICLTRMSNYSDKNEGADRIVRGLIFSTIGDILTSDPIASFEDMNERLSKQRDCRFVSCWSRNPESQAMWSMYSPDQCSVKIETTVGKLLELGRTAFLENWMQDEGEDFRDGVQNPRSSPMA